MIKRMGKSIKLNIAFQVLSSLIASESNKLIQRIATSLEGTLQTGPRKIANIKTSIKDSIYENQWRARNFLPV